MWSALFDDALPARLFDCLYRRLTSTDVEPFNRHSYWYALDAPPRLLVEHAIAALVPYIPACDAVRGVEWWVESPPPQRGVRWHYDVDHEIEHREQRYICPVFGSILYFGSVGGPTIIVDQFACGDGSASAPAPGEGVAYLPRPNRFGIFVGDLRHSVAATDDDETRLRLTMPLNWWHQKPEPPTCIEPPYGHPEFACLEATEDALRDAARGRAAAPIHLSRADLETLGERNNRPVWASAPAGRL